MSIRKTVWAVAWLVILFVYSSSTIFKTVDNVVGNANQATIFYTVEEKTGDWLIEYGEDEYVKDKIIILTGNLIIRSYGSLLLSNSIIMMNSSRSSEFSIVVDTTGTLTMLKNSKITVAPGAKSYSLFFMRNSRGDIKDSWLEYAGYDDLASHGVYVESSDITFRKVRFHNNSKGLYVVNSSPVITDCNFFQNHIALSALNATPVVKNCKFIENNYAIVVSSADITFENCLVASNTNGLQSYNSNISLENGVLTSNMYGICTFKSNLFVDATSLTSNHLGGSFNKSTVSFFNSTFNLNDKDLKLLHTNLTLLNTSFSDTKISLDLNSSLLVEWYLTVYVYETDTNLPVSNATIIIEVANNSHFFYKTDENGYAKYIMCPVYKKTYTATTYYTPYNITISKPNYITVRKTLYIMQNTDLRIALSAQFGEDWRFKNKDWIVKEGEVAFEKGYTLLLSGNITVKNGGTLTLANFKLIMNSTSSVRYLIKVEGGGNLNIENTEITSYNSDFGFDFLVLPDGRMNMLQSKVQHTVDFKIQSDFVRIKGCELSNNTYLCIEKASPFLLDNTIFLNKIGIYIYEGMPIVSGNRIFLNNGSGLVVYNATVTISNCEIKANAGHGVRIINSVAVLVSNKIVANTFGGVYIENSTVDLNANSITNHSQKDSWSIRAVKSTTQIISNKIGSNLNGIYVADTTHTYIFDNLIDSTSEISILAVANKGKFVVDSNSIFTSNIGIQIIGGCATILKNILQKITSYGIYCEYADVFVNQSNIGYINQIGLYIHFANCSIQNTLIYYCEHGVSAYKSTLQIDRGLLSANAYSIFSILSVVKVFNSTIVNADLYGIYARSSFLHLENSFVREMPHGLYFASDTYAKLVGNSFEEDKMYVGKNCSVEVYWFVDIKVEDIGGTGIENASVFLSNPQGINCTAVTDFTGWARKIKCIGYNKTYGTVPIYYTPYTITASYLDKSNTLQTKITSNTALVIRLDLNLPPRRTQLDYVAVYTYSVVLSWSESDAIDFERYEVHVSTYRNFIANESTLRATIYPRIQTKFNVTGLADNTQYWFKIKVVDKFGLENFSNEICIRTLNGPPPPVRVAVLSEKNITAESVEIVWTSADCGDFEKYVLIWSTAYNFVKNQSVTIKDINQTSCRVTNLTEYTVYYFKIRVFDDSFLYSDSNIVAVKTKVKNSKPLITVSITPSSRPYYVTTLIRWTVLYKDVDNDLPEKGEGFINLIINNNESYPMLEVDPQDRNAVDGKEYYCELKLPAGSHTYWVVVDDGALIPEGLPREEYCRASTQPVTIIVEDVKAFLLADLLKFAVLIGILIALVVIIKILITLTKSEVARAKVKKKIKHLKDRFQIGRKKGVTADKYRLK